MMMMRVKEKESIDVEKRGREIVGMESEINFYHYLILINANNNKNSWSVSHIINTTMSTLQITIPKFGPDHQQQCITYAVLTKTPQHEHSTRRRFREFITLANTLATLNNDSMIKNYTDKSKLPSKFFSTSPADRRLQLQEYLHNVVTFYAPKDGEGKCCCYIESFPQVLIDFLALGNDTSFAITTTTSLNPASSTINYGTPQPFPDGFTSQMEIAYQELIQASSSLNGNTATATTTSSSDNGWKLIGNNSTWQWFARSNPPNRVVMSKQKIYAPARLVHDLLLDINICKIMEPLVDSVVEIAKPNQHSVVQHWKMKSIMMQTPRDVILIRHWQVVVFPPSTMKTKIIHVDISTDEFPDMDKSGSNGYVRAKLTCGGTIITEIDPMTCSVIHMSNLDPMLGENIPNWILNKMNEFTSTMLSNNMIALSKIIAGKNVREYYEKHGPLVNWNGNVGVNQTNRFKNEINTIHDQVIVEKNSWYNYYIKQYYHVQGFAMLAIIAIIILVFGRILFYYV
jgi:hypothetical protein